MSGAVDGLITDVLAGRLGPDPADVVATSVFWAHHGTRLAGGDVTYRNQYVLARVGAAFGACAFEAGELTPEICAELSGQPLEKLLRDERLPLRIAALDAYLAATAPHHEAAHAEPVELPAGTPEVRAVARDAAIAGLLDLPAGAKVALIGVVNPLVAAIRARGAECLPCDLNLTTTQWGDPVTPSMRDVLPVADAVVATGMDDAARGLVRLLRPGGRFVVAVWRSGALEEFGAAYRDVVARVADGPGARGQAPQRSEAGRINTEDSLGTWLWSVGCADVKVRTRGLREPVSDELVWNLVLGSGFRSSLDGLDAAEVERVRVELPAELARRGVAEVDFSAVLGVGTRAD